MQQSLQSTYNYLVPADGTTHEVSFTGILVSGQPYTVDWHSFVQSNFPFRPQGAKMQNPSSENLTIENLQTGETSTCPPNSSRWVTFTSTAQMRQQISGDGQAQIIFVDYPVMETAPVSLTDGTPTPPASGDTVSVSNFPATQVIAGSTGALTDASGTITTASTSQQVTGAVSSRKYLLIQNNSTGDLGINLTAAATLTEPSIILTPGGSFTMEGSFVSNEAINIIGATAGQAFTCKVA